MKRLIFATLLLIAFFTTAKAQYFPVDTARLNKAYRTLKKGERTAQTEQEFLEAFPTTWLEWTMTYCYVWDDNYDISMSQMCCEHIEQLFGLPHINDSITLVICYIAIRLLETNSFARRLLFAKK